MTKPTLACSLLLVASLTGCLSIERSIDRKAHGDNPYEGKIYYTKYLDTGSALDRQISQKLGALRVDPRSATLHNDLGMLLTAKGFPKDAEVEFRRATFEDKRYVAAWYNLGQLRAARGDLGGAHRALSTAIDLKPGHAGALFALGLVEERLGQRKQAIAHYAKAYRINPDLLRVEINPQIIHSQLVADALLVLYPSGQAMNSTRYESGPAKASQASSEKKSKEQPKPASEEAVAKP